MVIWEVGGAFPPPGFRIKYGMTGFVIASPSACVYPVHRYGGGIVSSF